MRNGRDNLVTKREAEVLEHMNEGESNPEIGDSLGISHKTVDNHIANLMRKLRIFGHRSTKRLRLALVWIRIKQS